MSKPPRDHTSFGSDTHFVTASTWGHRSLFQTDSMACLFIDTIYRYRCERRFLIHEFVVMRDHFHLLMTPTQISAEKAIQFIKGGFSYRVKKELGLNREIWERGYIDHRIRDANDYSHHVEYTLESFESTNGADDRGISLFIRAPRIRARSMPARAKARLVSGRVIDTTGSRALLNPRPPTVRSSSDRFPI